MDNFVENNKDLVCKTLKSLSNDDLIKTCIKHITKKRELIDFIAIHDEYKTSDYLCKYIIRYNKYKLMNLFPYHYILNYLDEFLFNNIKFPYHEKYMIKKLEKIFYYYDNYIKYYDLILGDDFLIFQIYDN